MLLAVRVMCGVFDGPLLSTIGIRVGVSGREGFAEGLAFSWVYACLEYEEVKIRSFQMETSPEQGKAQYSFSISGRNINRGTQVR